FLPPPIADAATHGLAALTDDGHQYLATRLGRLRVFRRPRASRLRAVLRLRWAATAEAGATVGNTDPAFTVDVLLLDGDEAVMELTDLGFPRLERQPTDSVSVGTSTRAAQPGPARAAPVD